MPGLMKTRPRPGARVTGVNVAAFDDAMRRRDAVSNLEVANLLGCGEGTVSRIRAGEQNAGGSLISCVAITVTHDEFWAIFDFRVRVAS
jgi:hypothetical protein